MNWGNRLLLVFIVFASGMGYLVFRSRHVNFELVEKDYYKSELRYQDVIDGTNRANTLSTNVKLAQNNAGVLLELPVEMKERSITGDILFYCAYDEKKDKHFALHPTAEATQQFGSSDIFPGRYTVKINWSADGKNYFSEQQLNVVP